MKDNKTEHGALLFPAGSNSLAQIRIFRLYVLIHSLPFYLNEC